MKNYVGNFAILYQISLISALVYLPGINQGLGTRQLAFPHFAIPSMSFHISLIIYDEFRKILIRKGIVLDRGRFKNQGWFTRFYYY